MSYINCVLSKPTDDKDENFVNMLDSQEANNSNILTWINNSIEHFIGIQLAKCETKDMSIQEFYSTMSDLQDRLALTELAYLQSKVEYLAH